MNKRIILIMALLVGFSFQALAYDTEDMGSMMKKFGAKIGGNISTFGATPTDDRISSKFGFYLGAYSRTSLNDNFILQFELGYSALGAKQNYSTDINYTWPIGYITIGALVKFFPMEEMTGLNAHAGLQYGYMVYASESGLDRLNSFKGSDFDIVAGVGYELENGLNLELRYLLGLSNVWNEKTTGIYQIWKNRAIQIQLGWTF